MPPPTTNPQPQTKDSANKWFVIMASINASIGFAHYGYVYVIFNSIQVFLQKHIFPDASTLEISLLASAPSIGGALGAFCTGAISKKLGRRSTMLFSDILSVVGVLLVIPQQILPMVIGRIMTGFTAGIASVIVPIYITEISREPLRGPLGVIPNIASSLGIMLAYALGWTAPVFIKNNITEYGCDILLAIPAVMNLLRIINLVLFFDFETPFYLLQEQQKAQAKSTLELLYDENISDRLHSIVLEQEYLFEEKEKDIPIRELFKSKFRKIFLFALFLAFGRQFTGVNIILSFSNMIFAGDSHSLDSKLSLTLTTIIGVINLLFSFAAIPLLTNFGRRTLTIASLALLAGLQILIGLIIYFDSISNAFVHFLLFVVICVAELSIGAILFIYVAETLPETAVGLVILTL